VVGAGLVLAGLTAVVLASALLRLRIYQDAYGWTELRFYVLASIVWLATGIGITVALLWRDRMGWLLHGLAMAAVVVLIGINIVGPSRLIAEQNVARVLNPRLVPADGLTGLDVTYATRLGDDAIPALVAVLPALPPADRSELDLRLRMRRDALAAADTTGWPSWNVGREAARAALATLDR
jgi:two-component system sensor histidine kinase BaeS